MLAHIEATSPSSQILCAPYYHTVHLSHHHIACECTGRNASKVYSNQMEAGSSCLAIPPVAFPPRRAEVGVCINLWATSWLEII